MTVQTHSLPLWLGPKPVRSTLVAVGLLLLVAGFLWSSYFFVFAWTLALPFLGVVSVLGAVATLPLYPTHLVKSRLALAVAAFVLLGLRFDVPARELETALNRLGNIARTQGAATWTGREKLGATMLSQIMGRAALLQGFPEVAREHLGMHEEGAQVRIFRSVFPRDSATLRTFACDANGEATAVTKTLFFDASDPRYHLAFNGAQVTRRAHGAVIDIGLTIAIRYRPTSRTPLFLARGGLGGEHLFVIDEGIFAGLEQLGVLHRYTAQWDWRVPTSTCR